MFARNTIGESFRDGHNLTTVVDRFYMIPREDCRADGRSRNLPADRSNRVGITSNRDRRREHALERLTYTIATTHRTKTVRIAKMTAKAPT
jgi:hypothetical protein